MIQPMGISFFWKKCHQANFHGTNTPFNLKGEFGFKFDLDIQISTRIAFS